MQTHRKIKLRKYKVSICYDRGILRKISTKYTTIYPWYEDYSTYPKSDNPFLVGGGKFSYNSMSGYFFARNTQLVVITVDFVLFWLYLKM